jgi:hypothetical protein
MVSAAALSWASVLAVASSCVGTNTSTGNQSPRYCLLLISLPSAAVMVKVGASRPTPDALPMPGTS